MQTIYVALLAAAGLLLWVSVRRLAKPDLSETALLAFIFGIPILGLAASGGLAEFSGGGFAAKFRDISLTPVHRISRPIDNTLIVTPPKASELAGTKIEANFGICRPLIVLRVGDKSEKIQDSFVSYLAVVINTSISCGNFIGVVILDNDGHYLGSFSKDFFHEAGAIWAISIENRSAEEIAQFMLSRTVFAAALAYPDVRMKTGEGQNVSVREDISIAKAYERMRDKKFPFAAIINEDGRVTGVVTMEDVRNALLSTLIVMPTR